VRNDPLGSLAARVRYLIRVKFGESVNAAARAWGIPQRTLARIASGATTDPQASAVQRIADGAGVAPEWVLKGNGRGPDPMLAGPVTPANLEWARLVGSLRLPPDLEVAVRLLTLAPAIAWSTLTPPDARLKMMKDVRGALRMLDEEVANVDIFARAWSRLLRAKIEAHGVEAVRTRLLETSRDYIVAGFNPLLIEVLTEQLGVPSGRLSAAFEKWRREHSNRPPSLQEMDTDARQTSLEEIREHIAAMIRDARAKGDPPVVVAELLQFLRGVGRRVPDKSSLPRAGRDRSVRRKRPLSAGPKPDRAR
jgi:hypothetical protein